MPLKINVNYCKNSCEINKEILSNKTKLRIHQDVLKEASVSRKAGTQSVIKYSVQCIIVNKLLI